MTLLPRARRPFLAGSPAVEGDVSEGSPDSLHTPGEVASASGGLGKHPLQRRPLRVLFLSVEVEGFAKTGGLGDVAAALPKALRAQGVDVRVCLPRYGLISESKLDPQPVVDLLSVPLGNWHEPVTIRQGWLETSPPGPLSAPAERGNAKQQDGGSGPSPRRRGAGEFAEWSGPDTGEARGEVPVYLVQNGRHFEREHIYGYADDGERFVLYCRAALEMCRALGWAPDVVHCNDWHTGIVPNWLQTLYKDDPFFADTATVFTIHNLAYQGVFDYHLLWLAGIGEYGFLYPAITDFAGQVNLMGRGILFGDAITTVSERYAGEILTAEYGERLDPLLRDRQDRLFGILNGIDQTELDPRSDRHLAANFSVESLERRAENKAALQREAGLPVEPGVPLIGMVGRLSGQKGLDILAPVLAALLRRRLQFVLLGTGDEHYHQLLRSVEQAHPDQLRAFLTFDTPLAQRIYGGSDLFLMPSRYEPCGLGQMIAMRYGSVPVVRATGGLADTVQDWNPATGEGNGFRFDRYDGLDLFAALVRALETYHYPAEWRRLQVRGMQGDFSWQRSAGKYLDVYALALRFKERAAVIQARQTR